ncbi:MAG: hypothetical protein R3330_04165 [Saprospiraceae bacterium]|nr:hypothetical protein [Saprospiraceae bacterium]
MIEQHFEFARRRDFGDVVGDGFQFIIRHFKSLFTGFLMYVGPFVLLAALSQRGFMNALTYSPDTGILPFQFGANVILYIVAIMAASVMLVAFSYSAIQKYEDYPEERIIEGLWPYIRRNIVRILIVVVAVIAAFVFFTFAFFSIAMLTGLGGLLLILFVFIPLAIYLWVPLSLVTFVYLVEEGDLIDATRRAFYLVRGSWWQTFGVLLVIGIVAVIASSIFSIPAFMYGLTETLGSGADLTSVRVSPMAYAMGALSSLGSMFAGIYQLTGIALQYYNLKELKDGPGLMERIEQIDQLDDPD